MQEWQADFLKITPIFSDLHHLLIKKHWLDWPSCHTLNGLIPESAINYEGKKLTLVEQTPELLADGLYYEQRIYQQGIVPTRSHNWHDFFNALIYLLFPMTKREMNRLHVKHIEDSDSKKRSACRDAITLLDECGVIIAHCDDELAYDLQHHRWQAAFVDKRHTWGNTASAVMIGHANYEKSLKPYIGFTGKALYLKVTPDFFSMNMWDKYHYLDTMLSNNLELLLQDNSRLFPLPILGVPGWCDDNENSEFYENIQYFRPKRKSK